MNIIMNTKKFFAHHISNGGRVLKVTVNEYYIIESYERMSNEEIEDQWFIKFNGQSHAYRDNSILGGQKEIIGVHSLSIEDVDKMPDNQ